MSETNSVIYFFADDSIGRDFWYSRGVKNEREVRYRRRT